MPQQEVMAKQPRIGCAICKGSEEPGWVCEDHEDKPWKHDGCGGAGVHCACNPDSLVAWKEIVAEAWPGAAKSASPPRKRQAQKH